MTKKELLERLKIQPECLFSLKQVITLIEGIDDEQQENYAVVDKTSLVNDLINSIESSLRDMQLNNWIDYNSVVLNILNNKVYIQSIELNKVSILYQIRSEIIEFFDTQKISFVENKKDKEQEISDDNEEEYYVGDADGIVPEQ